MAVTHGSILALRFRDLPSDVCIAVELEFRSSVTQPHGSRPCKCYGLCQDHRAGTENRHSRKRPRSRATQAAERRLRESDEQYRLLVATIPEVVWKTDAKGNVIFVSPQVEALLGYSADEFLQQGDSLWFNSVHPDDKEKVGRAFESLINEGQTYDIECRARKKNGEWFWAHDRAVATSDSNGFRVATGLIS